MERRHLLNAAKLMLHLEGQGRAKLRESSCIIYERLSHKISIDGGPFARGRDRSATIIHSDGGGGIYVPPEVSRLSHSS